MPANKNKSRSRTSGPWDLVPSGYWDLGTLSLQAIGTLGHGPNSLKGQEHMPPHTVFVQYDFSQDGWSALMYAASDGHTELLPSY